MKYIITVLLFIPAFLIGQLSVNNLKVEHLSNPIGLGDLQPRFSWTLHSDQYNTMQTAYEIIVSSTLDFKKKTILWQSKNTSDQSILIPYQGPALQSNQKYYWKINIWDNHGMMASSSEVSYWQMGLLSPDDWKAKWISREPSLENSTNMGINDPNPILRKEFVLAKEIKSATLYMTARGLYEAELNGKRVGDYYLTPGWTSYKTRIQYQSYDITGQLKKGPNAIGVTLGNGWYKGFIGFSGQKGFYGKELAVLGQIMIIYKDGSSQIIGTDETWQASTGSILSSEIYNGEYIDARLHKKDWTMAGYNSSEWNKVMIKDFPKNVIATQNESIKKQESFIPQKIWTTPKGEQVIDFGQNLVGWVELKAQGSAGTKIEIEHAEVLDKQGNFYTTNLRAAKQKNIYILRGEGQEFFEPHFTFQGFRYIKIVGYPGEIKAENFKAVTVYSAIKKIGDFTCSDPLVNQLQKNIQWGQRGNFVDVPTDCPQRDERLGWTGDAQAFSRTAAYNFDVNNFFAKWLRDLEADQKANGSVPFVIPNVLGQNSMGSTGWADAATIIPWNTYWIYGDKTILEKQYNSMKQWVKYMEDSSKNDLWNRGFHFGDWLFYSLGDDTDGRSAVTDKYLIAQCFYAHSTQIMIDAAKVLNKPEDILYYGSLIKKVKAAFLEEYVTATGRLVSSTQTAYVLALNFDMLPENKRASAAAKLAENIIRYNKHITTGFLGTPYICHVLSRFGYTDLAYDLLLQTTYPSWLYPVKMGATTIWERWDGIKPDSSFQNAGMNSFNHYAYGAIGDWMYRSVCGIESASPGYKMSNIIPEPGKRLSEASAHTITPYGQIASSWVKSNNIITYTVEIPANTTASIYLPAKEISQVSGPASIAGYSVIGIENNKVKITVGSGKYKFEVKE